MAEVEQLNKIQLKAEVLTTITRLQTLQDASQVDELLYVLDNQTDKKAVLDTLMRELVKTTEQKAYILCFLLHRLCDKEQLENALWNTLKSPTVSDFVKTVVLNILKDLGNKVDYDNLEEYFESPDDVIDADTKQLLHTAIMNPEAQIDFLDFLYSLHDADKKSLVQSLAEDYTEDALANILIPVFLHDPSSKVGQLALEELGQSKSQLALHALLEAKEYVDDEFLPAIQRNVSSLKLAGVREDNTLDFYKEVLSESKPYESYSSYPDGHGNQALIFSREREDETIQIVATVISDKWGIVDCFGFNQISKKEFSRIVERFYGNDLPVFINHTVLKTLLMNAEETVHKHGELMSYEYICWRNLLHDIPTEPVPMQYILEDKFEKKTLTKKELDKICLAEETQKWFIDTDFSVKFYDFTEKLNNNFKKDNYDIDLDEAIEEDLSKLIDKDEEKIWSKRIMNVAYLKYLANEKNLAGLFYALYFDEDAKHELFKNIIRKSMYEYYVSIKFKLDETKKTANLFRRNSDYEDEITITKAQAEKVIEKIEKAWVQE